ncbi:MAG: rod-binding protein [Spirochaetes bacterium]|nr:rod-binding protein [Spirochaetota bacterium]
MIGIDNVINNAVSNRITSVEKTLDRLNSSDRFDSEMKNPVDKYYDALPGSQKDNAFETELKKTIDKYNPSKMDHTHKRLWDACVEAESLLIAKMLKEMKKTVPKNEWLHGGHAEEIFEDMLYDEYALNMSKNYNFGMARLLYDEMSRKI